MLNLLNKSIKPTINGFNSKAAAIRHLRNNGHSICSLLCKDGGNPKINKNGKVVEVETGGLHLAPSWSSGFNTCAEASEGCIAACLNTAGNPAYMESKLLSRLNKTQAYFKQRKAFMAVLVFEMLAHRRKHMALGKAVAYRLNCTSDLPIENLSIDYNGQNIGLMALFHGCQFYDYTAILKRMKKFCTGAMPVNYHLTFSRKENNDSSVQEVMAMGGNVAVCMESSVYKAAISSGLYNGYKVTNGDLHDYRPSDISNSYVVLKAKGDAKTDTSGFTIRKGVTV